MLATIQTYKVPIIVTLLSMVGFAWWFTSAPRHIHRLGQRRNGQIAAELYHHVEGTLRGLSPLCTFRDAAIRQVLENLVDRSELGYIVLQKGKRRIIATSRAPAAIHLPSDEGQRLDKGRFLYWRRLTPPCREEREKVQERRTGLTANPGDYVLILGGEIPMDQEAFKEAMQGHHFAMAIAVLFVMASALAWILSIRDRLLVEKLKRERFRSEHLEDLSLAAAGLAHETKNPLGIISGMAQQILRGHDIPACSRRIFEQIVDEVDNALARLGHFMAFARQRNVTIAALDASNVITHVTRVLETEFEAKGVELLADAPLEFVFADEEILRQILVNLLLNSLSASTKGGKVVIRMDSAGSRARLFVEDWGSGIAPELMPDIFKPYVTGRSKGHGLGLAIVKRHVEDHGWTIRIAPKADKGTVAVISGIKRAKGPRRNKFHK